MLDNYKREINYLRISVTNRCMMHCIYCDPSGSDCAADREMSVENIITIGKAAAAAGIEHIRLTGGEPLLRRDLPKIIAGLRSIPSIRTIAVTTNGLLLREQLPDLIKAGLTSVNISLDTVNADEFRNITGLKALHQVMDAVSFAVSCGIQTKINAVSIAEDIGHYTALLDAFADQPVDVRFIELMPIGEGKELRGLSHEKLLAMLYEVYPSLYPDEQTIHGQGPACYYRIPGRAGAIGLISAASRKFCSSCNRIRITSDAYLKPCLCYDAGISLKGITDERILKDLIMEQIRRKPMEHCFEQPQNITENRKMSQIGG